MMCQFHGDIFLIYRALSKPLSINLLFDLILNFVIIYINLAVTEDGLTAKTGLTIKKFHCGIGISFTIHLLIQTIAKNVQKLKELF